MDISSRHHIPPPSPVSLKADLLQFIFIFLLTDPYFPYFPPIPMDVEGDVFGKIYEYFLGEFAMTEGQKGGEFFTPTSIVKLIVDIIEPFHGRIYDPACGSGGMFVQSARFVKEHRKKPSDELSVFGEERVDETVRLCRMNLAVHGLAGDIKQCNSYYEDLHKSAGKFDFVMANPPFNVDKVDKERLKGDVRFPFGMPKVDNANYLWIQLFYSSLNVKGRAGFVMANSAADARASELEIRRKLIEDRAVDVVVAIGPNFFYTVALPCTLWFFDKAKRTLSPSPQPSPIGRGCRQAGEGDRAVGKWLPAGKYRDVAGLCKVATIKEIEAQGWSLNPGRYVGVAVGKEDDFDFYERLEEQNEELEKLNAEAHELEERIAENVAKLMEAGQ